MNESTNYTDILKAMKNFESAYRKHERWQKIPQMIRKLFGYCYTCKTWFNTDIAEREIDTFLLGEALRKGVSCQKCYDEESRYWKEAEEEYYKKYK